MRTIDRHIVGEWLKAFLLTVAATVGLLVVQQVYAELRDLLAFGASLQEILVFYAVALPAYLALVLPVSFLLSLLYALGTLHRNNEFVALRAAGISLARCTRWLWAAGLLLSLVVLALNASVIPWSVEQGRAWRENLELRAQARGASPAEVGVEYGLGFDNSRERRLWMMNRFSRFTLHGYGVTVSELDYRRRERRRIMAREAWFDDARGCWVFVDGRDMRFDPILGETTASTPFPELREPAFTDNPRTMLLLSKRARELSLFELDHLLSRFSPSENPRFLAHVVRRETLLAGSLGCLIVVGLAIPFAIGGVRVNPAVGISKSLGLFVLYYLLSSFSTLAGETGHLPPSLAAWLPNLGMLGLSLFLFLRLR